MLVEFKFGLRLPTFLFDTTDSICPTLPIKCFGLSESFPLKLFKLLGYIDRYFNAYTWTASAFLKNTYIFYKNITTGQEQ